MTAAMPSGTAIAWRPPIAGTLAHLQREGRLQFTEVVAETFARVTHQPHSLIFSVRARRWCHTG